MFKKWFTHRNKLGTLAILFFLLVALSLAVLLVSAAPGRATSETQVGAPTIISYQGQVLVSDAPFNGSGYFKFAFVNATGDTTYWSNNGTSTGGGEPTQGVVLPVSNGLFNVLLGDTTLTNMTQELSVAAFNGTQRYLRVWFSSDGTAYQKLGGDQRIASVPFALQAVNADTVDGQHAADLALPTGAMVMGRGTNDTTLIAAGFSYTGVTLAADDWVVKADMPTGRHMLAAGAVDGIIYAIGGSSDVVDTTYEQTNEAYDPVTNSWSTKAPMPTGRHMLAAAAVDGIIYAIGGTSGPGIYEQTNEAYNPTTNTWSTQANMPTGRKVFAVAVADGVIYAIGGIPSTGDANINEAYNPTTNTWSTKAPMPTERFGLAAAAVDGRIYAIGGFTLGGERANEVYNPTTNTWWTAVDIPNGGFLAAVTIDGLIYTVSGSSGGEEVYNPDINSWSTTSRMPTERQEFAVAAVNDVIYAIGGKTGAQVINANEAYYPALPVYIKE